jgi:hypothetical protein
MLASTDRAAASAALVTWVATLSERLVAIHVNRQGRGGTAIRRFRAEYREPGRHG